MNLRNDVNNTGREYDQYEKSKNIWFERKYSSKCYVTINAPHEEIVDASPAFFNKEEGEKWCKMKNRNNQWNLLENDI